MINTKSWMKHFKGKRLDDHLTEFHWTFWPIPNIKSWNSSST